MSKAFLGSLQHESDVPAHLQQAAGIFLRLRRQFIVILDGNLFGEQEAEILQIVFLHNDDHFLYAGIQCFFDDQQDGRFGYAIPVNDRE